MQSFPSNYFERVYAGVLGKLIGVYMGRPVENWRHEDIVANYGEVRSYLSLAQGRRTVVTDDDIAGTFTFLRALEDYDYDPELTSAQVGQTWLNYIIENRSILWWGGLYHSTEHTAFLNLKRGIPAPRSGSIEMNGSVIANQIGAQIYIDGWAMVSPGDPQRAADLAERAARVSHDDEAVNAARLVAAMEALAFVEADIQLLLDGGLRLVPAESLICRLAHDVREWHAKDGDWRKTFARISEEYGYKKYVGGCHVVPNHALILLGLLYGQGDFDESLAVTATCGWDVDCNAGNLGCLLGIRGGLAAFEGGYDWRGPLVDRLFISSADGGRAISDALSEALVVANAGRALAGMPLLAPKDGARFHFSQPGSVQGFQALGARLANPRGEGLEIILEPSKAGEPARVATATFILPGDLGDMGGYPLLASPMLYPGQAVSARLKADPANLSFIQAGLFLRYYSSMDQPADLSGPQVRLAPGEEADLAWTVPDPDGGPVFEIGIQAAPADRVASACRLTLDRLGWSGSPKVEFRRPQRSDGGYPELWRRAWVNAVDHWENRFNHAFRIIQDRGRGILITGIREWQDYRVSAQITSALFASGGIAARVQGLERFYALELVRGGRVRLLKALDGVRILGEVEFDWRIWQPYELSLEVRGAHLRGWVDGTLVFDLIDDQRPLLGGGIALTVYEGHLASHAIRVDSHLTPVTQSV